MKIPQKAPKLHEILSQLTPEELTAAINTMTTVEDTKYLHWDELRHRPPPENLNHTQWWAAIKLGRNRNMRRVDGLLSTRGEPFQYGLPDAILQAAHDIDSRARGSIGVVEPSMNSADRNRYMVSSIMEEAITSSQLEGAATTRKVAAEMLRSGRPPQDQSERMILNNYRAMQHILTLTKEELTPEKIIELQRILTQDTLENPQASGRLQQVGEERVRVIDGRDQTILHTPPPAEQLPERLIRLCDFANDKTGAKGFLHPVVRAIILHFWLAYDHPFEDGNGRTARALFYWSMLRHGYWLFEYLSISSLLRKAPARYSRSYQHTETDENDLTYFILEQMRVIQAALKALQAYLERKQQEVRDTEKRIRNSAWMNHRQRALVAHALRHPNFEYSIASHKNSHKVAYATARADLLGLVDKKMFMQKKQGKKIIFLEAEQLQDIRQGDIHV